MFAFVGAFCSAGAAIQVRRLTATREDRRHRPLLFDPDHAACGSSTILLGWRVPDRWTSRCSSSIGILGGIGQILLTQCYRYADTSIIAPFEYTTMIWALLLGWFVFGELPTLPVSVGGAIVAAAGLFVDLAGAPARPSCATRNSQPPRSAPPGADAAR